MYLLFAKGLAVLALVAGLLWGWHVFTEHYRDQGRAEVQADWNADVERRRELTTSITLAWNDARIKAEAAGKERDDERTKRFAEAQQRARTLPPAVAAAVVPAPAVELLNAAVDHSAAPAGSADTPVAAPAAAAQGPDRPGADSTVGLLVTWGLTAIEYYDACRARVSEWEVFYRDLQAAQPVAP